MIKVESGIPVPQSKPTERRGATAKYPWREMEVGDSFKAQGWDPKKVAYYQQLGNNWAKRNNVDARFEAGFHHKQLRVWRIA